MSYGITVHSPENFVRFIELCASDRSAWAMSYYREALRR